MNARYGRTELPCHLLSISCVLLRFAIARRRKKQEIGREILPEILPFYNVCPSRSDFWVGHRGDSFEWGFTGRSNLTVGRCANAWVASAHRCSAHCNHGGDANAKFPPAHCTFRRPTCHDRRIQVSDNCFVLHLLMSLTYGRSVVVNRVIDRSSCSIL